MSIRNLKAKKAEHLQKANALNAIADRELTTDEQSALAGHIDAVRALNAQIEGAEFLANQDAGLNAGGSVQLPAGASLSVSDNLAADPKRGFGSFGEFASAVVRASRDATRPDSRLLIGAAAPGTTASENAGADGGFLVPPQYSRDLFMLSLQEGSLMPLTDNTEVQSNSMVFPKTEQTPWGTNGVRAYWQAEATAATATKPVIGTQALRLHKLMALVPLTDELVADTNALDSTVPRLIGDSIRWKTNEAILFGSGNGQPMGALLSSGPVLTQAKDTGQAANTLSTLNLFNMISRLPPDSYSRAIWLMHPTVLPVLATLVLGQIPVFIPGPNVGMGGLNQMPQFGSILGRPLIISHHAAALSSAGDVQLHDLSYYRTITKAGGVQTATSMHLYFDADAMALRATLRMDGSPKIASAISPAKGSVTLSPFIQLGVR